jgi:hypothetical protein
MDGSGRVFEVKSCRSNLVSFPIYLSGESRRVISRNNPCLVQHKIIIFICVFQWRYPCQIQPAFSTFFGLKGQPRVNFLQRSTERREYSFAWHCIFNPTKKSIMKNTSNHNASDNKLTKSEKPKDASKSAYPNSNTYTTPTNTTPGVGGNFQRDKEGGKKNSMADES